MTSQLITQAGKDVRSKIRRHGGGTPLVADYEYVHRDLELRAWQYMSEEETQVTYTMVLDMITGLRDNLLRVALGECTVDLALMVGGEPREAGAGSLTFRHDLASNSSNGTMTSSSKGTNGTVTDISSTQNVSNVTAPSLPGGPDGAATISLEADVWHCHMPNTRTQIVITKLPNGRTMPIMETLQLVNHAARDIRLKINQRGGDPPLEHHGYTYEENGFAVQAHQSPGPLTYQMVFDMMAGLSNCFWHVNYVESKVDIFTTTRAPPVGSSGSKRFQGSDARLGLSMKIGSGFIGILGRSTPADRSRLAMAQTSDVSTA